MTESESVRWQFWGLGVFFGVILPGAVGVVVTVWGWVRRKRGCEAGHEGSGG
jgi:hypothetical protein